MTNYFGKARLKSPKKKKNLRNRKWNSEQQQMNNGRGCTDEAIFHYSKFNSCEWFECSDYERRYKIWADGEKSKVVTVDEYAYNENDGYVQVSRIQ